MAAATFWSYDHPSESRGYPPVLASAIVTIAITTCIAANFLLAHVATLSRNKLAEVIIFSAYLSVPAVIVLEFMPCLGSHPSAQKKKILTPEINADRVDTKRIVEDYCPEGECRTSCRSQERLHCFGFSRDTNAAPSFTGL